MGSSRGKAKTENLSARDYLKSVTKQRELLTKIRLSAKKAGLDKLSDEEITAEIAVYRKSKIK